MYDRAKLRADLERDEGLRLVPYKDTEGYWTIGFGHLLGNTPRMQSITRREAEALLEGDIDEAQRRLAFILNVPPRIDVTEPRYRALMNMSFNLGGKLSQFTKMLIAVRIGNWEKAAQEALDSLWAKQVGKRADRIATMLYSGEDPDA